MLYISKNEPLDDAQVQKLITESGIQESKMKLNIERLEKAGLLGGKLIRGLGSEYFTHAISLKLSYSGVKEVQSLLERKKGIKNIELNLGLIKFGL